MTIESNDKSKRKAIDYRMFWRWHFYAGLLCLPIILMLAITGPIYLFKPQVETAIDRQYDHLSFDGAPMSAEAAINAALAAVPNTKFRSIEVTQDTHDAFRIIVGNKGEKIRVYVHPKTLKILKTVKEKDRFMEVAKTIHGELLAGKVGELIVETMACWAIVLILTGLYLWWPRDLALDIKGLGGILYPRLFGVDKRLFWRDLHAVVGFYAVFFALFLLFTGLPWTTVWGAGFKEVRKLTHTAVAQQDWSNNRREEKTAEAELTGGGEHADHDMANMKMSGMVHTQMIDYNGLDQMITTVRGERWESPVMIKPPSKKQKDWVALSETQNRPHRQSATLDPITGQIIKRSTFADKHPIDQVIGYLIAAHEGQLFGPLNQALGLLTAFALVTLCVSAIIMWLKRKPSDGTLGAPHQLPDERLGIGLLAIIAVLALLLPMFGITLVAVVIIEKLVLKNIRPVSEWMGLK